MRIRNQKVAPRHHHRRRRRRRRRRRSRCQRHLHKLSGHFVLLLCICVSMHLERAAGWEMQPADTQELQLKTFVMRRLCDGRVWLGLGWVAGEWNGNGNLVNYNGCGSSSRVIRGRQWVAVGGKGEVAHGCAANCNSKRRTGRKCKIQIWQMTWT